MATDYDAWRPHEDSVTVADVVKVMHDNADAARFIAATILEKLVTEIGGGSDADILSGEAGSMRFSIMPHSHHQREEDRKKLAYILPEYFPDASD